MRAILCVLTILIPAFAADIASAEIQYPWCRQSSDGGTNCGFTTLEQCQSGGTRAFCIQNSQYQGSANASAPGRARRR
jgi:hypothetical protein